MEESLHNTNQGRSRLRTRFSPLLFTCCLAFLGAKLAQLWQTDARLYSLPILGRQFPLRAGGTVATVLLWTYGYGKIFTTLGFSRWLAIPLVVVGFTPLAWIFTRWLGFDRSFITLLAIQLPFAVACILRRSRTRYEVESGHEVG
jgi:hypothetical protein